MTRPIPGPTQAAGAPGSPLLRLLASIGGGGSSPMGGPPAGAEEMAPGMDYMALARMRRSGMTPMPGMGGEPHMPPSIPGTMAPPMGGGMQPLGAPPMMGQPMGGPPGGGPLPGLPGAGGGPAMGPYTKGVMRVPSVMPNS